MEQISRVNPRSVDFEAIRSTVKGLTSGEIAAMLVDATDGEYYLAMSKYAGMEHIQIVSWYLFKRREQFKVKKATFKLIELAVTEIIDPCRCLNCGGTQFINARVCPECDGRGYSKLSHDQKSNYIGKGKGRVYESVYSVLNDWDCEALYLFSLQINA